MRRYLHILSLFLTTLTSVSFATSVEHKAIKIYTQDMQTQLAQGTMTITQDNGVTQHLMLYHDMQGKEIYSMENRYQTESLKTLYSKEWFKGPKGIFQVVVKLENEEYITRITDPDGETKIKTMSYSDGSYMGVTISKKLESSLEPLINGQKVVFDILAPGVGQRFSFGFKLKGEQKIAGHDCYVIAMKAENWLIATMAPDIHYYVDKLSGRVIANSSPWGFNDNGNDYAITLILPPH